jgi:hypothetical protein
VRFHRIHVARDAGAEPAACWIGAFVDGTGRRQTCKERYNRGVPPKHNVHRRLHSSSAVPSQPREYSSFDEAAGNDCDKVVTISCRFFLRVATAPTDRFFRAKTTAYTSSGKAASVTD